MLVLVLVLVSCGDADADADAHSVGVGIVRVDTWTLICVLNEKYKYMKTIEWGDFEQVELRVGTIIAVDDFPEARKPAYKLTIEFGGDIGQLKSSAQITELYTKDVLLGRQIMAVVNFPQKQIGPFMSQCLVTGFANEDGAVVLAIPDASVANDKVANGAKLH